MGLSITKMMDVAKGINTPAIFIWPLLDSMEKGFFVVLPLSKVHIILSRKNIVNDRNNQKIQDNTFVK